MGYIGAIIGALTAIASGTAKGVKNKKNREADKAAAQAANRERQAGAMADRGAGEQAGFGAGPVAPAGAASPAPTTTPGTIPMQGAEYGRSPLDDDEFGRY